MKLKHNKLEKSRFLAINLNKINKKNKKNKKNRKDVEVLI